MANNYQPKPFALESKLRSESAQKSVHLTLPPAHPKQFELLDALYCVPGRRFIVGACGTKFGGVAPQSLER